MDTIANALQAQPLTLEAIGADVAREHYVTAAGDTPGVTQTFCILTLHNGILAIGRSTCHDKALYDEDDEGLIARDDAARKIWPLMVHALTELLARAPATVVTRTYCDGSTFTGRPPLPDTPPPADA